MLRVLKVLRVFSVYVREKRTNPQPDTNTLAHIRRRFTLNTLNKPITGAGFALNITLNTTLNTFNI